MLGIPDYADGGESKLGVKELERFLDSATSRMERWKSTAKVTTGFLILSVCMIVFLGYQREWASLGVWVASIVVQLGTWCFNHAKFKEAQVEVSCLEDRIYLVKQFILRSSSSDGGNTSKDPV